MFQGKKSQILSSFKKNEKPQSIYRMAIHTEKSNLKDFRKNPPQLLLMYIF